MTFAWYGHLKDKGMPLWKAIFISWGIAFFDIALWFLPQVRLYKRMSAFNLNFTRNYNVSGFYCICRSVSEGAI
jgi:uncharacterized protein (DUF486 family)